MTRTALGIPTVRPVHGHGAIVLDQPFRQSAQEQLGNAQMRANIRHATHTIRGKRARVVEELPDWQELRRAGSALKQQVMADLPALHARAAAGRLDGVNSFATAAVTDRTMQLVADDAAGVTRTVPQAISSRALSSQARPRRFSWLRSRREVGSRS